MKTVSLIINISVYFLLFVVLFIKVTDVNRRGICEKIILFAFMVWSLFLTACLTETFIFYSDKPLNVHLTVFETVTDVLMLIFFITKIKDDKIFKK